MPGPNPASFIPAVGSAAAVIAASAGAGAAAGTGGFLATGVWSAHAGTFGAVGAGFPIGIVVIGAMLVYSIATRPNPKDRRSPGSSFLLRENPTDPNEPIGLGYGMPTFVPPILCRYLKRGGINQLAYQADAQDLYVAVLSLGGGPLDGRDLKCWMNDEPVFASTPAEATADDRTLDAVDVARTRFRFRAKDVVTDSVVLYRDGVLVGANASGGGIADTVERTVDGAKVDPTTFAGDEVLKAGFPPQTGPRRYGGFLPLDTTLQGIRSIAVDLVPKTYKFVRLSPKPATSLFSTGIISSRQSLPSSHVHLSATPDGRTFFWVGIDTDGQFSGENVSHFYVTVTARPTITIVRDPDGTSYAVFQSTQSGTITATFKTSRFTDGAGKPLVELILRKGEADQEALPTDDGIRNTRHVGAELSPGSPAVYETANEVHDVEVGIASGPEGFVDIATTGTNAGATRQATRRLQIRLKARAAPTTGGTGTDLSSGWIGLAHPKTGTTMPVTGQVSGQARWSFSVAELYFFTRDGKESPGASLPLGHYDVEVRAIDVAGNRNDNRAHASIQSRVFLDHATELVRVRLSLPYHATLTVRVSDAKLLEAEPVFAVRLAMRRVTVPASAAEVLDLGDGQKPYERVGGALVPSPRRWSRNNVWCAIDIVTDPFFGAGQWYDWLAIRLAGNAGAHEGAAWCDSTTSGEVMAELDVWLNRRSAVLDHVSQMFAGARILPALTGGTWEFPIDRDESPVLELTDTDFERGAAVSHASIEEIPTEIEAAFQDDDAGGELAPHTVALPATDPRRRVARRVDMTGVRRRSQLDRVLKVHLAQFQLQKDAVDQVGANWRMLPLRAGRIVRVTSEEAGWTAQLARVMLVAWGSNLKAVARFTLHNPDAYDWAGFKGPNGGVPPATRPPSDTVKAGSSGTGGETGTQSGLIPKSTYAAIEVFQKTVLKKFKASKVSTLEAS